MKSSIASLLYLIGITWYAGEVCYWTYPSSENYLYWLLLVLTLPHYYLLYKNKPKSNFVNYHNWLIPLSVIISLETIADKLEELMVIAYFSLFGLLYLIGESNFFAHLKSRNNTYRILGSLGIIIMLMMLSFDPFWEELRGQNLLLNEVVKAPEFFASLILSLSGMVLLYLNQKVKTIANIKPLSPIFIVFILIFIVGVYSPISILLINILVFATGILIIRDGAKQNHLGILNFGLLTIAVLVTCRFFDTDLSFVFRGILFITVGIGFFATNYWILKKRKTNDI